MPTLLAAISPLRGLTADWQRRTFLKPSRRKSGGFTRWLYPSLCLIVCLFVRLSPTRTCRPLADWRARAAAGVDARPHRCMDTRTMGVVSHMFLPPRKTLPPRKIVRDVCKRATLLKIVFCFVVNYTVRHNYRTPGFNWHNLVSVQFIWTKIADNIAEEMLKLHVWK